MKEVLLIGSEHLTARPLNRIKELLDAYKPKIVGVEDHFNVDYERELIKKLKVKTYEEIMQEFSSRGKKFSEFHQGLLKLLKELDLDVSPIDYYDRDAEDRLLTVYGLTRLILNPQKPVDSLITIFKENNFKHMEYIRKREDRMAENITSLASQYGDTAAVFGYFHLSGVNHLLKNIWSMPTITEEIGPIHLTTQEKYLEIKLRGTKKLDKKGENDLILKGAISSCLMGDVRESYEEISKKYRKLERIKNMNKFIKKLRAYSSGVHIRGYKLSDLLYSVPFNQGGTSLTYVAADHITSFLNSYDE